MLKNITKAAAALMVVVLLLVLAAVPALAADLRSANTVTIASGEVVNDDLYISATDIIINGTVNGDVYAGATNVTINGTVNGGVTVGAQIININGEITGSARLGANSVNISGDIGGDLLIGGSMVYINSSASIGRDLLFGAGSAVVNAPVGGYIKGGGDEITLTNTVGEDVEVMVERLTIASTADIQGNLIYISDNQADISSGANIGGNITHRFPDTDGRGTVTPPGPFAGIVGRVLPFLMALLVGVIIVLVAPDRTNAIAKAIRSKPWASLGWGAIPAHRHPDCCGAGVYYCRWYPTGVYRDSSLCDSYLPQPGNGGFVYRAVDYQLFQRSRKPGYSDRCFNSGSGYLLPAPDDTVCGLLYYAARCSAGAGGFARFGKGAAF